ncbi:MAG: methionyl-tRNA formyltransferase [Campylobacteraceae bacterium]|nr:methionyl-tRNA formyltransferase [Campylobacteraceae bacterium]
MKIVFMGTPSYATTILEALCHEDDMEVVLLVTQQDKPVGRKQILTPPHTKAWVLENGLHVEIYQPKTLRTTEAHDKIASLKPDFIVVAAYGQILPKAILDIAPCINLHASLLPKYRGASPIQSSLLANDIYTGVTSMLMEEGLDTGAMLGFSYLKTNDDNASILFDKLAHLAAKLTLQTLKNFHQLSPIQQIDANASHCKKIKKEDGLVSFELQSAQEIDTKFKALTPWPGLFLDSGLKLLDIQLMSRTKKGVQGTICAFDKEGAQISCKEGILMLKSVQPFSKSPMNALDYIRGKRLSVGDILV